MESFKEFPCDAIIKKPVVLRVGEASSDFRSGCAVVDVLFPGTDTVNIDRISFKNNYCSSVEIRMKVYGPDSNEVWKQCIKKTKLMPEPHYEAGSQSYFEFTARDMCMPTDKVIMIRIILRQSSPHWANFGIDDLKCFPPSSLTSSPSWLSLQQDTDSVQGNKQFHQALPDPTQVSQSMQQMWAMMEEIKASQTDRLIGRFDVDGSYDINLLSYT
ncbi:nicolin-1 isoform X1 [Nematostella vectensis]|uniref:nicolin-1 isoform X1 n=1 Tax=Nematostella vectensis TaxID=45351 RepID=UPI00207719D3|nr:nicolin-1 isoform X1 [Nematostella vectensis]